MCTVVLPPGDSPLTVNKYIVYQLNPICHLLALLGGATIVVVSRLRVNVTNEMQLLKTLLLSLLYMFRALLAHHQELTKTVRAAYSDGMR